MNVDFVRGHMGGNLIILLQGDQLPPGRELEVAVKLMGPNYLHAHEAGILYHTDQPGELAVKIADPTISCFISACGGFTQVLGAALIETDLGDLFGVARNDPLCNVMLQTDCGPTALNIETLNQKAVRIKTDMDCFVQECYERGVSGMICSDVEVFKSGKFLVMNADLVHKVYPQADFTSWNQETRQIVKAIQNSFFQQTGEVEPNIALYDWHSVSGGDLRVVFPHYVQDNFFEPSCGTGSVALGIALFAAGELADLIKPDQHCLTLNIESGGSIELGGPDFTTLELTLEPSKIKTARFSHSLVEITSVGQARF